jgi:Holliday junction resolvase RusA-like endonuclease
LKKYAFYGELISSKNSRQSVRIRGRSGKMKSVPIKSKAARENCREVQSILLESKDVSTVWLKDLALKSHGSSQPVRIVFKIFRRSRRRFDYVNIVQNLLDELVRAGWLVDDDADHVIPYFEPYEVDKKNPRTILHIEEIQSIFSIVN